MWCCKSEITTKQRPLDLATQQLAEKLHTPIIRKFEKLKVHSSLIDNILVANLADMQLISKFNKVIQF